MIFNETLDVWYGPRKNIFWLVGWDGLVIKPGDNFCWLESKWLEQCLVEFVYIGTT